TKRIDPPKELVAWDARPINGELALYCAGIRVADPTRLDTNPDLTRRGRRQFPLHHFQAAGLTRLHGAIACRCHRRLLRFENALLTSAASKRRSRVPAGFLDCLGHRSTAPQVRCAAAVASVSASREGSWGRAPPATCSPAGGTRPRGASRPPRYPG